MKKFLILFFICVSVISMQAQKRYVIAFDCTKSMNHPDGDYTDKGLDDSKLWKPAKDCIHSLWTQASPVDEFVILLFQNNVLEIVKGRKSTHLKDWNYIERRMNDAIKKSGNTCILKAWQTAEQYFTNNCDFYFITDGVEDHDNNGQINDDEQTDIDVVCRKIDDFCNLGINGFYTNLKQSENDNINNQISRKVKQSCFKDLIAGSITPTSLSLSQEDINKGKKTYGLTFNPVDRHRVANVRELDVKFLDDVENARVKNPNKYFNITISGISNNNIELTIDQHTPVPYDLLDDSSSCRLYLSVSSNDKDVAVFPQLITMDVRYYYEKIAYLPTIELEGTSNYHPAFFIKPLANLFSNCDFIAEHRPDTIEFDLKQMLNDRILFNNEAIKHNCSYKLKLVPIREKDKDAKFILLKNNEICNGNIIEVLSTDNNLKVGIVFYESSADGTFKFKLEPIDSKGLDKINECTNISEASIPVSVKFEKNKNLLSCFFVCLLILLFLLCVFRIAFVRLPYRRLNAHLYYIVDGYEELLLSLDNCTVGVISSKNQKQSFLCKLFNGKYCYSTLIKGLNEDIFVKFDSTDLRGNRILKLFSKGSYKISSVNISGSLLTRNEESKYFISDKNNNEILTIKYF